MQTSTNPNSTLPIGNGSDGPLGKAATGAHGAVDKAAAGAQGAVDKAAGAAEEALRKAKPIINRVADTAHQAVDKAVNVAVPTAEWLNAQSETLKASQEKAVAEARSYVSANPLKSVGAALLAGLVIGRLMR